MYGLLRVLAVDLEFPGAVTIKTALGNAMVPYLLPGLAIAITVWLILWIVGMVIRQRAIGDDERTAHAEFHQQEIDDHAREEAGYVHGRVGDVWGDDYRD